MRVISSVDQSGLPAPGLSESPRVAVLPVTPSQTAQWLPACETADGPWHRSYQCSGPAPAGGPVYGRGPRRSDTNARLSGPTDPGELPLTYPLPVHSPGRPPNGGVL